MNSDPLFGITAFLVIKWFLVVGLVMYFAFSVVIVRQVGVMSEAIDDPYNPLIKLFAWSHLLMTLLLLVVSILIL